MRIIVVDKSRNPHLKLIKLYIPIHSHFSCSLSPTGFPHSHHQTHALRLLNNLTPNRSSVCISGDHSKQLQLDLTWSPLALIRSLHFAAQYTHITTIASPKSRETARSRTLPIKLSHAAKQVKLITMFYRSPFRILHYADECDVSR